MKTPSLWPLRPRLTKHTNNGRYERQQRQRRSGLVTRSTSKYARNERQREGKRNPSNSSCSVRFSLELFGTCSTTLYRPERKRENRDAKKSVYVNAHQLSPTWLTIFFLDFQLTYARKEWYEEKAAWRAVIFLNLVRNVNEILAHLTSEMSDLPFHPEESQEDLTAPRPPRALPHLKFIDKHSILRMRLGPLSSVQQILETKIGTASLEPHSTSVNTAAPFDQPSPSGRRGLQEFSINSSNGWKTALDKFRTLRTAPSNGRQENGAAQAGPSVTRRARDSEEEIVEVIASCREDIKTLWEDDIITEMLNRRKVRLEDAPGL